ncbi:MAG: hypothetical protein IJ222_02170 [Bacteroidales bacterium]|nr:hypothetical protein [Bacteroidales bacterium]
MSAELAAAFNEKYPKGFNDWFQDLTRYTKPDGTPFYAVTIEIPDAIYLVKIKVETDDIEDIERWLEGEETAEAEQVAGPSADADPGAGTLPDDNISQYGGDDGDSDGE